MDAAHGLQKPVNLFAGDDASYAPVARERVDERMRLNRKGAKNAKDINQISSFASLAPLRLR
jgi:hypothetical protein